MASVQRNHQRNETDLYLCTPALSNQVLPLVSEPGPGCANLGNVVGVGKALYLAEQVEGAINDAKNKAAERNASHVILSAPVSTRGESGTIVVTAIAYRCAPGTASEAPASSALVPPPPPSNPGPKTFLATCPAKEGESARERALRCRALDP